MKGAAAGARVVRGTPALRLTAVAAGAFLLVALAYRRPCTYRIDVGADDASYVEGFQQRAGQEGADWRWSADRALLHFHDAGQIVSHPRLRIRLGGLSAGDGASAPQVSLALDGRPLASFSVPDRVAVRTFELDRSGLGSGDWILSIATAGAQRRGARSLGLRVDWAELESRSGAALPPLRTAALFVLAVVSCYVLLASRWPASRAALGCGTAALLGAALLGWAREAAVAALPGLALVAWLAAAILLLRRASAFARLQALAAYRPHTVLGAGIALAFAGQALMSLGLPAAAALLLAGLAALAATAPPVLAPEPPLGQRAEWTLLAAITAVALLFRTYRLAEVPFAIYRDEARHGSVALGILAGDLPPSLFLGPPINQPLPYFLALAASFELLGASVASMRLVSALAGVAAVPLTFWLSRTLAGPRLALVAAFGLAASSWHVSVSRLSINYVEPQLLTLPAYLFWLRGLRHGALRHFVIGGLLAGLAQFASHTAKASVLVLLATAVDESVRRLRAGERGSLARLLAGCALGAAAALLVVTPILREVVRSPAAYTARMTQVSIWENANAQARYPHARLFDGMKGYAGAFNVQGDANGRHHLPGAPLLDPVSAACFAIGAALLLRGAADCRHRFLIYWCLAGLVPGLVSVDPPTATRIIEAAPAVYAIAAAGALVCWRAAAASGVARGCAAALVLAAAVLAWNGWTYFVAMYQSPRVWGKFAPVSTRLGEQLRRLQDEGAVAPGNRLYAPSAFLRHADDPLVLRFLMPGFELRAFDAEGARPHPGDWVVLPNYRDLWVHLAGPAPSDVAEAQKAAAELDVWRRQLGSRLGPPLAIGPPFPGTSSPTFWLYRVESEGSAGVDDSIQAPPRHTSPS